MMMTRMLLAGTLALMASATACGRNADDTATTSRGDVEIAALRVTEVDLGRAIGGDNRITDETDEFRPNDTIYASVRTTGGATGTLTARWVFEDGQVVDSTSRSITPTGDAATEFHISRPSGFPKGDYKVEILLDGSVVATEQFEVR